MDAAIGAVAAGLLVALIIAVPEATVVAGLIFVVAAICGLAGWL